MNWREKFNDKSPVPFGAVAFIAALVGLGTIKASYDVKKQNKDKEMGK